MRLKVYTAQTLPKALEKAKKELGLDAVVVSSEERDGMASVTMALDQPMPGMVYTATATHDETWSQGEILLADTPLMPQLSYVMDFHNFPPDLCQSFLSLVDGRDDALYDCITNVLAKSIDFAHKSLPSSLELPYKTIMLLGPPGAGKTLTIAKIAAQHVLLSKPVEVICLDTQKTGAVLQLEHLMMAIGLVVRVCQTPEEFRDTLNSMDPGASILIDTPGLNPYDSTDVELLSGYLRYMPVPPIGVLPAGLDAYDAAEICAVLRAMQVTTLLTTRMDTARRMAGIAYAAFVNQLSLLGYTDSPLVGEFMHPWCAQTFAEHLLIALPDAPAETTDEAQSTQ